MSQSLRHLFEIHFKPSQEGEVFLDNLENNIAHDLWKSAGGMWSLQSQDFFRKMAMQKLAEYLQSPVGSSYARAWEYVVRDFHQNYWNERRLQKKEVRPKTEDQKIFWELFSYVWTLLQTVFITKTAVFYFGIKSAEEDSTEGKIYVVLAILFSFVSLISFAYRKSKKSGE